MLIFPGLRRAFKSIQTLSASDDPSSSSSAVFPRYGFIGARHAFRRVHERTHFSGGGRRGGIFFHRSESQRNFVPSPPAASTSARRHRFATAYRPRVHTRVSADIGAGSSPKGHCAHLSRAAPGRCVGSPGQRHRATTVIIIRIVIIMRLLRCPMNHDLRQNGSGNLFDLGTPTVISFFCT